MNLEYRDLHIENCTISNVLMKLPELYHEYWVEIRIPKDNSCFYDYDMVKIQCSSFKEELLNLKNDVVDRLYLSRAMVDIDIFKKGNQYVIDYSPVECTHVFYYFNKTDFEEIFQSLGI